MTKKTTQIPGDFPVRALNKSYKQAKLAAEKMFEGVNPRHFANATLVAQQSDEMACENEKVKKK